MKKLASLLLLLLLLTGCTVPGKAPEKDYEALIRERLSGDYTMTADFTVSGVSGSALAEKTGTDRLVLSVTAPESMAGLCLTAEGEDLTLRMGEIEMELPADTVPPESVIAVLREVFCGTGRYETEAADGIVTAKASNGLIRYTVTFREEDMTPLSVALTGLPFTVTVTEFTPAEAI